MPAARRAVAVVQHGDFRDGSVRLPRIVLTARALSACALSALALTGLDPAALAAPQEGAPASEADMTLYTRTAALNVCISLAADIPFDKAVAIAGETMAQVIQHQHGGAIQQVGGKPLSLDDLRKGSINSAVLGASEVCPKDLPAEVMRNVEAAVQRSSGSEAIPPPAPPGPASSR